jgi:hypothetical protein
MKKLSILGLILIICILASCLSRREARLSLYELQKTPGSLNEPDSILTLPGIYQETGNADSGYNYLLHGDMFSSGMPYPLYKFFFKTANRKLLTLAGYNEYVLNDFTVFRKDRLLATPGCLHCHSQVFNGQQVIGLGNSYGKYQVRTTAFVKLANFLLRTMYGKRSPEWKDGERFSVAGEILSPELVLEMQGPNPAHRIADIMAAHRDPQTLQLRTDTQYFKPGPVHLPTDIPALWLAKKKNAWNYNAMMQGSAVKNLMIATILTVRDSNEASAIYKKMTDVWAYLQTLKGPTYPYPINIELARKGEQVFKSNCSGCHGTYGANSIYPNKLVPAGMIGTDSLMLKYYRDYRGYEEWYNKSWYATSKQPGFLNPYYGYIAPPLDGVWITAPYLHNGSVPTVEAVLNSRIRPRYWKRNFKAEEYDYEKLGWKYRELKKSGNRQSYNTDIPGYGNYGHYFGDALTESERRSVIEYLKTL